MFSVGDIVEATVRITRVDGRSVLNVGELAKISQVFEGKKHQIVAIEIKDRLPIMDIVCSSESYPLKLAAIK